MPEECVDEFAITSLESLSPIGTSVVVWRLCTKRYLTLNIQLVGKQKSSDWIGEGIEVYETRLGPVMTINTIFYKSDENLVTAVKSNKGVTIAMDETGRQYTSREFSQLVFESFEKGGTHLNFIIGGPDGLPDYIKGNYRLISMSKMTWTHRMARLLLLEQVYRASEIHKGSNYHKD